MLSIQCSQRKKNMQTSFHRKTPRERLIESTYELIVRNGINRVGIGAILETSGCAKASLYDHFNSKTNLIIAALQHRHQVWTIDWFSVEIERSSEEPGERLLAIFNVLDAWFRQPDYSGCPFTSALISSQPGSEVHNACTKHMSAIRSILHTLAIDAQLQRPDEFVNVWHMLIKGSAVSAYEGNRNAGLEARQAAELILQSWPTT